jgi:tol-pal system protein YbgF
MSKTVLYGSLCAALVSLWACVQPQQIELIEREQRRLRTGASGTQSEVASLRSEVAALRSDVDAIRSNTADTRATLQQLDRDFRAVKETIDETRYQMGRQLGQSSREGDQRIKDLEARIIKMDEALKTQESQLKAREDELKQLRESLAAQSAQATLPPAELSETPAAETDAIKRDYGAATRALEQKDYKLAIGRFRDFLKKHPKSRLANNAQYWIGESYYALRQFDQAILEFDAVRRKYPQGEKVPAALLKQGFAFAELGEKVNARLILQEVVEKYPQSPEAARAKQRLKTLES